MDFEEVLIAISVEKLLSLIIKSYEETKPKLDSVHEKGIQMV